MEGERTCDVIFIRCFTMVKDIRSMERDEAKEQKKKETKEDNHSKEVVLMADTDIYTFKRGDICREGQNTINIKKGDVDNYNFYKMDKVNTKTALKNQTNIVAEPKQDPSRFEKLMDRLVEISEENKKISEENKKISEENKKISEENKKLKIQVEILMTDKALLELGDLCELYTVYLVVPWIKSNDSTLSNIKNWSQFVQTMQKDVTEYYEGSLTKEQLKLNHPILKSAEISLNVDLVDIMEIKRSRRDIAHQNKQSVKQQNDFISKIESQSSQYPPSFSSQYAATYTQMIADLKKVLRSQHLP